MIDKLQQLKDKSKLSFYQTISIYFDEIGYRSSNTFQFKEDPFAKNAQGIGNFFYEVLILMKFVQTKSQVKNVNINYYDLFYTVIKNIEGKE